MIRCAFVTGWYPTPDNPINGIFVRNFAKALAKYCRYCEVYVIHYYRSNEGFIKIKLSKEEWFKLIRVTINKNFLPISYIIFPILLLFILSKYRFHIIIAVNYTTVLYISLYKMLTMLRVPLLYQEHSADIFTHNTFKRILIRIAATFSDVIIPVSKTLAIIFSKHIIMQNPRKNIKVIYNCVDEEDALQCLQTNGSLDINSNANMKPLVLSIARLVPEKGVLYLVEAARRLNCSINVYIVGDGPLRKYIEDYIRGCNLSCIKLLGLVLGKEKWELIKSCDIFVLPSHIETMGVVIAEALMCGKPVLTSSITGYELVPSYAGMLFKYGDVDELSEKLKLMVKKHWNQYLIKSYAMRYFSCKIAGLHLSRLCINMIRWRKS